MQRLNALSLLSRLKALASYFSVRSQSDGLWACTASVDKDGLSCRHQFQKIA